MKLLYPLFLLENYFLTLLSAYLNFFPARKKREIIFSTPQTSILIQPPFFPTLLPRKKGRFTDIRTHTTRSHMAWKRRRKRNRDRGCARFSVFGGGRREIQLLSSEKRRRRRRDTYTLSLLLLCRDSHLFTEKTMYSYKC